MKIYLLILSTLLAGSSYASKIVCPPDAHKAFEVGLEKAAEEGFTVELYDLVKVDVTECRIIRIVVPTQKNEKLFSGITLILQNNGSHAGQFDIVPKKYENGTKLGATFEICKNSSDAVIVASFYGEKCNTNSYAVSIKPWNM